MQDKIILGFLMSGDKTGYEVRKSMQTSTEFIFNTSLGSIYPAFKKLEKAEMVTCRKIIESGRHKKIYSITGTGKKCFQEWMDEPTYKTQVVLIKIFFFSYVDAEKRKKIISHYLDGLNQELNELVVIKQHLSNQKVDYFAYQNLLYGIEHLEFLIKWFQKFFKKLSGEK